MVFYNKLKWILGITLIFVLIIATNLIDSYNFIRVRDAVVTIYEDRLIVNDILFEMQTAVHQKEVALIMRDSTFFKKGNTKINSQLQSLLTKYEQTKLTEEEAYEFDELKKNIAMLNESEEKISQFNSTHNSQVVNQLEKVKANLSSLSKIQLNEGNRQMSIGKGAVDAVELFTQIEIYILVFLAILIQIVIMYKPKVKP